MTSTKHLFYVVFIKHWQAGFISKPVTSDQWPVTLKPSDVHIWCVIMGSPERLRTAQSSQIQLTLTLWNENERENFLVPNIKWKLRWRLSDYQTLSEIKTQDSKRTWKFWNFKQRNKWTSRRQWTVTILNFINVVTNNKEDMKIVIWILKWKKNQKKKWHQVTRWQSTFEMSLWASGP